LFSELDGERFNRIDKDIANEFGLDRQVVSTRRLTWDAWGAECVAPPGFNWCHVPEARVFLSTSREHVEENLEATSRLG